MALAAYYFSVTAWALVTTKWAELAQRGRDRAAATGQSLALGVAGGGEAEGVPEVRVIPQPLPSYTWSLP